MQTKFLFIDAETDGLYGSFLTVGLVVTDDAGNMIEKAYYGIKKENMMISDVWTRENVFRCWVIMKPVKMKQSCLKKCGLSG